MKRILQSSGLTLLICGVLILFAGHHGFGLDETAHVPRRPITVADIIGLTRVVPLGRSQIAVFSPDETRFLVLLSKGNIVSNTNEYYLELFRSHNPTEQEPRILISLSSSSNRPAIQDVKWLSDKSVAFLGENPGEQQQLYIIDVDSGKLTRSTDHQTNLTTYTVAPNGDVFFIAENSVASLLDEAAQHDGIVINQQVLPDLISLRGHFEAEAHETLFVKRSGAKNEILVQKEGINAFSAFYPPPSLSPDGRYLIVKTMVTEKPPSEWAEYQDRWIRQGIQLGSPSEGMYRFELIDTTSLEIRPLLNAPTGFAHSDILWASDSRAVVIGGTYLPLGGTHGPEREARQRKRFSVEISVPDGNFTTITDEDVQLELWDVSSGTLQGRANGKDEQVVRYQKIGIAWRKLDVTKRSESSDRPIEISLDEDPNTPPKLYVRDTATGRKSLLLNPNPAFDQFQLGKVEEIDFKASNGAPVKGSLYFPVEYSSGNRYPLVIQTHGDDLSKFMVDGPYTTAFAAQPLSGKGFFVAQLKEDPGRIRMPHEVSDEVAAYEGVIDYLDARSLIERERVGIIAFSRTGFPVEFALTHSKYHFAAAALADISDSGYFRYVAFLNLPEAAWDSEQVNEAAPFGTGMAVWLKNSPGFNLDKVRTPVRLEANDPMSLMAHWEWYAVLSHLGKPVELLYLPDGEHALVKPSHRLASQQGNVDWFCFWLEGERDDDPSKAQEYKRWNSLKEHSYFQVQ